MDTRLKAPSDPRSAAGESAPRHASPRVVARLPGRGFVFLDIPEIWAFECSDRAVLVHSPHGTFEVELTLFELELELMLGAAFLHVHGNWLVAVSKVREMRQGPEAHLLVGEGGDVEGRLQVPIARERLSEVRRVLLGGAIGVRVRHRP